MGREGEEMGVRKDGNEGEVRGTGKEDEELNDRKREGGRRKYSRGKEIKKRKGMR